ncbi:GNAT family N-acetyltransferase [Halomarina litorea]|uniref:GNAT family N-acetyltransferase n=1 Tax=Halomarina litorea TaxID=2961595 RepID=UPI0020C34872|nr:GNAT family N-acetyltransferase [Halomarina sp. BCD28]
MSVRVRTATPDDFVPVMRVLDGSLLDVEATTVEERIDRGAVLVAVADGDTAGRVVGTLVLDTLEPHPAAPRPEEQAPETRHVEAVAVHRRHRSAGVGTALVEAAAERCDYLTAEFREEVGPFYESLGFDVERGNSGRCHGMR